MSAPADLPADAWHLVAATGTVTSVAEALDVAERDRHRTWTAWVYRDGRYVAADGIVPGEALWILHHEDWPLPHPRTGVATGHTAVDVVPGWALVGNPFDAFVHAGALSIVAEGACAEGCTLGSAGAEGVVDPVLWRWTGTGYARTFGAFGVGEGVWLRAFVPVIVTIEDPYRPAD